MKVEPHFYHFKLATTDFSAIIRFKVGLVKGQNRNHAPVPLSKWREVFEGFDKISSK
jgi:hypothetical protein